MKKQKIILGGAALMLASLMTGCGETTIEVQLPDLIPVSQLEEKYNENNKIEINLWTGFGSTMSDALQEVIDSFETKYPYISIKHEQKGGYDKLHSAVVNSIPSSSYPNVAVGYPDHFADYISSNIQYALDGYIESEEYGVDLSDYYSQYMRENQSLLYKDDAKTKPYTMGIPFNKSTEVMVYNNDFFEAFDLTVPTTWDEVVTTGKNIIEIIKTKDGANHFNTNWTYKNPTTNKEYTFDFTGVSESDFYPISYDSQANFFITMVYQFGGKYTKMGDNLEEGYMVFKDDEKVLEALNFVQNMYKQHVLGIPTVWNETSYCSVPFKALKSVMTISSSAGITNNIPSGDKFSVGIAPIPYKDASKKFVISQGTNMAIFKSDAEHALASWLFIRYATGGEASAEENANVDFAIASGYLPVTQSGEESDWYKQYLAMDQGKISASDKAKISVQKIANDVYIKENWDKFVDAAFIGSSIIREEVTNIIPLFVTGGSGKVYSPEDAIKLVYSQLPEYVEK